MTRYQQIQAVRRHAGSNCRAAKQGRRPEAIFALRSEQVWNQPLSCMQTFRLQVVRTAIVCGELGRLSEEEAENLKRRYVLGGNLSEQESMVLTAMHARLTPQWPE
jgi:hypothetical protein